MTNNIIKVFTVVLAVLVLGVVGLYFKSSDNLGAAGIGQNHYQAENFLQGLYGGTRGQFVVSNVGALTSSGAMTLSGALTQSGAATFTSGLTLETIRFGGIKTLASAATTTLTAADVCDTTNGMLLFSPKTANSSTTLPSATALIADCLDTVGEYKDVLYGNSSTTGSSFLLAGASSTLLTNASGTASVSVNAGKYAVLRFQYTSSTAGTVDVFGTLFE